MSSIRGGPSHGRARGRGTGLNARRGASSSRGRLSNGGPPRGAFTARAAFGQAGRSNATTTNGGIAHTNGFSKQASRGSAMGNAQARGSWQERYDKLEKDRKRERAQAIAEGSIADPDKPRTLSEAITPVGRCMDMCAEYERVQRVVQSDVWPDERDQNDTSPNPEPDESRFVKKFRRAAAGIDEQLPSDLRAPQALKQTCDFLFDDIVANAPSLGSVHHFVWDRTRAIRNDFTILQVSTPQDLTFAVECFERIARFHILSLHQMAVDEKPHFSYDWQQDREQLDRTLLSLMQFYDDSRGKIELPNEPEFRAYLIVFQLQDPIPDLEDRVQNWPVNVIKHPRVRKALTLYAAACNTLDVQGPLKPGAPQVVAQQDWQRFWNYIDSTRTSYLMACTAEIYFNLVRRTALQGLLRSTNQRSSGDSTVDDICNMLYLDSEDETEVFCNRYNISFNDGPDGQRVIDLSALKNRHKLPEPSPAPPKQIKSFAVEEKRFGRTFPAIINGLSVKEAQDAGMIDNSLMMEDDAMEETANSSQFDGADGSNASPANDNQSLFLPNDKKPETEQNSAWSDAQPSIFDPPKGNPSMFGQPSGQQQTKPLSFGSTSPAAFGAAPSTPGMFGASSQSAAPQAEKPKFNFLSSGSNAQGSTPKSNETQAPVANGFLDFGKTASPSVDKPSALSGFNFAGGPATGSVAEAGPRLDSSGFNFTSQASGTDGAKDGSASTLFGQPAKAAGSQTFTFGSQNYQPPTVTPASPSPTSSETPDLPKEKRVSQNGFSGFSGSAGGSTLFPGAPASFGAPASKASPSSPPSLSIQPETTSLQAPSFDFTQPPTAKASPPKSISKSTARKTSTSDLFNKPAKPSPLAQSFTFGGNPHFNQEQNSVRPPSSSQKSLPSFGGAKAAAPSLFPNIPTASHQPDEELFPGKQSGAKQSKPAEAKLAKVPSEPDFTSIVGDLAKYIALEPFSGLLDQYIDFVAGKIITDVQEALYLERAHAEADEFRTTVLSYRYGTLWRDICRRERLARQGRERRRRNRQRLLESQSQASETGSSVGAESFYGGSVMGSARGSVIDEQSRRQEVVDKQFQQSLGGGRWSKMAKEKQTRGGSKRPRSSLGGAAGPALQGHKRFKSTSHVGGDGRVTKLSPTSNPSTAAFARSSFLGSLPGEAPLRNSTKTNYFKLKAMGQPAISDAANARARKRQRSEISGSPAESPASAAVYTPSSAAASPPVLVTALERRSSSTSAKALKTREDDDALFARLRAARESLKETTNFFQTEASRVDDDLYKSTSSYESPSLERARVEARWHASQSANQNASGPDVPAYRLRESRFVPRENYGKAIERSREFRASRSGNTSRPESRTEARDMFESPTVSAIQPDQAASIPTFAKPPPPPSFGSFAPTSVPSNSMSSPSHEPGPSALQFDEPPAASTESSGFAAFGQPYQLFNGFPAGPRLESYQSNYDLEISFPDSQGVSAIELKDNTIQPSQIPQSLAASFANTQAPNHTQPSYQTQSANTPEAQQNLYLYTQAETAVPDGSDDNLQAMSVSMPQVNGSNAQDTRVTSQAQTFIEDQHEDEDFQYGHDSANPFAALGNGAEETEEYSDAGGFVDDANRYAALANGTEETEDSDDGGFIDGANHFAALANGAADDDEEEEEDEEEREDEEEEGESVEEETHWEEDDAPGDDYSRGGRYPAPPHYTGQFDDDFDGEDEDSEGVDDMEGYDDTEEATEEDEDPGQLFDPRMQQAQGPPTASPGANPAFAGGGTEVDAIELSD